jgi:hypothetical protein
MPVDSMAESRETDHNISEAIDQNAPDGSARPHCLSDQSSGMQRRTADINPDLNTVPKESVLLMLALFSKGLLWPKAHQFLLKISVDHLSERAAYRIEKLFAPSLFGLAEAGGNHYFKQVLLKERSSFLMEAGAILKMLPD